MFTLDVAGVDLGMVWTELAQSRLGGISNEPIVLAAGVTAGLVIVVDCNLCAGPGEMYCGLSTFRGLTKLGKFGSVLGAAGIAVAARGLLGSTKLGRFGSVRGADGMKTGLVGNTGALGVSGRASVKGSGDDWIGPDMLRFEIAPLDGVLEPVVEAECDFQRVGRISRSLADK